MLRRNSGIDQYPIPGADLDSFAYRTPPGRFRVFEVDHPATQGSNGNCRPPRASPNRLRSPSCRSASKPTGRPKWTGPGSPRVRELARCHDAPDPGGDCRDIAGSGRIRVGIGNRRRSPAAPETAGRGRHRLRRSRRAGRRREG
ncbi:class I SAM-dependent methyltransferase [Amycolatopsis sp. cmx-4-61]|uniref:class I SAM-dependent methyltransferase n=1 Tax=Amycolatopsis sp. cmx-4-61 TaxID=2790937 RepID=UPI00397C7F65